MKHRILYVEDEPFLGKIVKETLENQNYDLMWINDGALVMNTFADFTPDICILDVMLPNVDGFSLGRQIRSIYPAMPIIFLTAKIEIDDVIKGFDSGGTDYIKKPFSVKELIVRIQNQLKLKSNTNGINNEQAEEIMLGNIRFIPAKYQLIAGSNQIKLSSRESQVLIVLIAHQNQTVKRKLLLMTVWGDDSYFNSRNLDVYIRKLREHLSADPSIEIITLKGEGYHFIVPDRLD